MIANAEQGQKQAHQTVPKAEHLFQLYSQLPQFANDPCEWPLVQCY